MKIMETEADTDGWASLVIWDKSSDVAAHICVRGGDSTGYGGFLYSVIEPTADWGPEMLAAVGRVFARLAEQAKERGVTL